MPINFDALVLTPCMNTFARLPLMIINPLCRSRKTPAYTRRARHGIEPPVTRSFKKISNR